MTDHPHSDPMTANGRHGYLIALADPAWPPISGGDLRNISLYEALLALGPTRPVTFSLRRPHDQDALPPNTASFPMPLAEGVVARSALRLRATATRRHPFLQRLIEGGVPSALADELRRMRPDVCVLTFPVLGPCLDVVLESGSRLVVDLGEVRGPLARRRLGRGGVADRLRGASDLLAAGSTEAAVARRAHQVWFASRGDAQAFAETTGRTDARVIPNAISVESYARYRGIERGAGRFAYLGSFDYAPNHEAAMRIIERILPAVRSVLPDARVRLVGRRPSPDLLRAVGAASGVELLADVPDALAAVAEASPMVVPLMSGAGTKLKILEAAASGIPIISTTVGLAGIGLVPGRDCLVADDDASIVEAILTVWRDPSLAGRLVDGALQVVIGEHDQAVVDRLVRDALTA